MKAPCRRSIARIASSTPRQSSVSVSRPCCCRYAADCAIVGSRALSERVRASSQSLSEAILVARMAENVRREHDRLIERRVRRS